MFHGDLGRSIRYNQTVTKLLAQRYPYTLRLTLASLFVAIILSIPAGVRSARRRNRWDDRLLSVVSLFGLSFPNFALGPILILLFAIKARMAAGFGCGIVRESCSPCAHDGRRAGRHPHPHGTDVACWKN